jgi:hypothetical protein
VLLAWLWASAAPLPGQTATDIAGIYNTGETATGSLVTQGDVVSSGIWSVTYASTNGGTNASSTYQGNTYAISGTPSGYTPDTSTAEWIVAPGASTSTTNTTGSQYVNKGGNNLPGNGTGSGSGTNQGVYVYTLAFTITGSGSAGTKVTSAMSIDMTLAADDGYNVFVNPAGIGVDPTGSPLTTYTVAPAASDTAGAWSDTTQVVLSNGTNGTNGNSIFSIGTNYISVIVDNTNNLSSSSSTSVWNQSGLLDYNSAAFLGTQEVMSNGRVVPEVTPWLPLAGAAALCGLFFLRRFLCA